MNKWQISSSCWCFFTGQLTVLISPTQVTKFVILWYDWESWTDVSNLYFSIAIVMWRAAVRGENNNGIWNIAGLVAVSVNNTKEYITCLESWWNNLIQWNMTCKEFILLTKRIPASVLWSEVLQFFLWGNIPDQHLSINNKLCTYSNCI